MTEKGFRSRRKDVFLFFPCVFVCALDLEPRSTDQLRTLGQEVFENKGEIKIFR